MALNTLIRRVSTSRVVPLALRFASGSQRYHHQCSAIFSAVNRRSDLCGIIDRRSMLSAFHPYCSLPAVDNTVVRVLDEEIVCAIEVEDADKPPQAPPEDFPFKIEDSPSRTTITLSRDYQGEKITVEVGMSSVTGEEGEYEGSQDDDINQEVEFCLVVRVARNKKSFLQFECTAYADEISINSLSLKNHNKFEEEDELAYDGPVFSTLDEKLQKALHKYLEVRGIKPSITNFLVEYMVKKDSREYLLWLNNIKEFMKY